MALTQQEWFEKIASFVPSWWFTEQGHYAEAIFQGLAAVFAQVEQDSEDQFDQTFLTRATSPVLDLLGSERHIDPLPGETPALYLKRIQQITSHPAKADILAFIDSILLTPGAKIFQAPQDSPYCSRGSFCGRDDYLLQLRKNFFLVVVPKQVHAPYSFTGRSLYCGRGSYVGSLDSTAAAYATIIAGVNQLKAFGVMWGLVESST